MIITIHIRHPLLLSLFYNIIINFTSVQCLFATLHDIFFWLHVCKVVFDQAFSSLPLFTRFGRMCIQAKPFHPSPCSQNLDVHSSKTFSSPPLFTTFGCAFKQNLFIPPLVHNIWMCIQAKPFHPSPCSQHLDVHSSKTFSSLPLFKTFGCAFKQNLFIPPFVQDICMCIQAKTLPSLPSKPSCKYGGTRMSCLFPCP
jgi:hypothetical protein